MPANEGNLGAYLFTKLPYITMDLGTANSIVYVRGKGIVFNEPTALIKNIVSNQYIAFGREAREMEGKTNRSLISIRPLVGGVINDFEATIHYVSAIFKKSGIEELMKGAILLLATPSEISKLELNALKGVARSFGVKYVFIEEEIMMSALGAGIDIYSKLGHMVVDIGGGTTDIGVIAAGQIVSSTSLKVAGNYFDQEITKFLKQNYGLVIGRRSAEFIKRNYVDVIPEEDQYLKPEKIIVLGRDVRNGLPKKAEILTSDLVKAIMPGVRRIAIAIHGLLENTPNQLVGDIKQTGIMLCGGGSLLIGLNKYLEEKFGVEVNVAKSPLTTVIDGTVNFDSEIATRLANYDEWYAIETASQH